MKAGLLIVALSTLIAFATADGSCLNGGVTLGSCSSNSECAISGLCDVDTCSAWPGQAEGTCLCPTGFTGPFCESCESGYFGQNCIPCLTCENGGVCDENTEGHCECPTGFAGLTCSVCAPGYYGDACRPCDCPTAQTCDDGLYGTGTCTCPTNLAGESCDIPCKASCDSEDDKPFICNDGPEGTGDCFVTCFVNDMCADSREEDCPGQDASCLIPDCNTFSCSCNPRDAGVPCGENGLCDNDGHCVCEDGWGNDPSDPGAGDCSLRPPQCELDDDCPVCGDCEVAVCDPYKRFCSCELLDAGTTCGQGQVCSDQGSCECADGSELSSSGGCSPQGAQQCAGNAGCIEYCGECASATCNDNNVCECSPLAEGETCRPNGLCNDENLCVCADGFIELNGLCTAIECAVDVDCDAECVNVCEVGECDPATLQCSCVQADNGTTCNPNAECNELGNCVCSEGFITVNGGCVPIECAVNTDCDSECTEDCSVGFCDGNTLQCGCQDALTGSSCGSNAVCTADAECVCEEGHIENGSGACIAIECAINSDCDSNCTSACEIGLCSALQQCLCQDAPEGYSCAPSAECTEEQECACLPGFTYIDGWCIVVECGQNSDCDSGCNETCTVGECTDVECSCIPASPGSSCGDNASCSAGQECTCNEGFILVDGACMAIQCGVDDDCDAECNAVCSEGSCNDETLQCSCVAAPVNSTCGTNEVCSSNQLCDCEDGYVRVDGVCIAKECDVDIDCDANCPDLCQMGDCDGNTFQCACVDSPLNTPCSLNAVCNVDNLCVCQEGFIDIEGVCTAIQCSVDSDCDGGCTDDNCTVGACDANLQCGCQLAQPGLECASNAECTAEGACECISEHILVDGSCIPIECNANLDCNAGCTDVCSVGDCDDATRQCGCTFAAEGFACGANAECSAEQECLCVEGYVLVNGSCLASECTSDAACDKGCADVCAVGQCNMDTQQCGCQAAEPGTPCNANAECNDADEPECVCSSGFVAVEGACIEIQCNDHSECNSGCGDVCSQGFCNGTTLQCGCEAVEPGTECGTNAECSEAAECICTEGHVEVDGACFAVQCGLDSDCDANCTDVCSVGSCDNSTLQCGCVFAPQGESCGDNAACNAGGACLCVDNHVLVEGECIIAECSGDEDCHEGCPDSCQTGSCNEENSQCSCVAVDAGSSCGFQAECTEDSLCACLPPFVAFNGTCVECTANSHCGNVTCDAGSCSGPVCNLDDNTCGCGLADEGTVCADNRTCTDIGDCECAEGFIEVDGECLEKQCSLPVDCVCGGFCFLPACDEETAQCSCQLRDEGSVCGPNAVCNGIGTCTCKEGFLFYEGTCIERQCFVDDDCSAFCGECEPGTCSNVNGQCECGDLVIGYECAPNAECTAGAECVCLEGYIALRGECTEIECALDADCNCTDVCTTGSCDDGTLQCSCVPAAEDTPCAENAVCNDNSTCLCLDGFHEVEGECLAIECGNHTDCDAGCSVNATCSVGFCDAETLQCGCVDAPAGYSCGTNAACLEDTTCACVEGFIDIEGTCTAIECGLDADCHANCTETCTVGVCDPSTLQCGCAVALEGHSCDTNAACTAESTCECLEGFINLDGNCTAIECGVDEDCDDSCGEACEIGSCDLDTLQCGCKPAEQGIFCADNASCSAIGTCVCNGGFYPLEGSCMEIQCFGLGFDSDCDERCEEPCFVGECDELLQCSCKAGPRGAACGENAECNAGGSCLCVDGTVLVDGECIEAQCEVDEDCASGCPDSCQIGVCDQETSQCSCSQLDAGTVCADNAECDDDGLCGCLPGFVADSQSVCILSQCTNSTECDEGCDIGSCLVGECDEYEQCQCAQALQGTTCSAEDGRTCTVDGACAECTIDAECGHLNCTESACAVPLCNTTSLTCECGLEPIGTSCGENRGCAEDGACLCEDGYIEHEGECLFIECGVDDDCNDGCEGLTCFSGFCNATTLQCSCETVEEGTACGDNAVCNVNATCGCAAGFVSIDDVCVGMQCSNSTDCADECLVQGAVAECVSAECDENMQCNCGFLAEGEVCGENSACNGDGACECAEGYFEFDGACKLIECAVDEDCAEECLASDCAIPACDVELMECVCGVAEIGSSCGTNATCADGGLCQCAEGFARVNGECVMDQCDVDEDCGNCSECQNPRCNPLTSTCSCENKFWNTPCGAEDSNQACNFDGECVCRVNYVLVGDVCLFEECTADANCDQQCPSPCQKGVCDISTKQCSENCAPDPAATDCNGHGFCDEDAECACEPYYWGIGCEKTCPDDANGDKCGGPEQGECFPFVIDGPNEPYCECRNGWFGDNCEFIEPIVTVVEPTTMHVAPVEGDVMVLEVSGLDFQNPSQDSLWELTCRYEWAPATPGGPDRYTYAPGTYLGPQRMTCPRPDPALVGGAARLAVSNGQEYISGATESLFFDAWTPVVGGRTKTVVGFGESVGLTGSGFVRDPSGLASSVRQTGVTADELARARARGRCSWNDWVSDVPVVVEDDSTVECTAPANVTVLGADADLSKVNLRYSSDAGVSWSNPVPMELDPTRTGDPENEDPNNNGWLWFFLIMMLVAAVIFAVCIVRSSSAQEWRTRARREVLAELQKAKETNAAAGGKAGVGSEFSSPSTGRSAVSRGSESDSIASTGALVGKTEAKPMMKPRRVPVPAVPDMDAEDESSDDGSPPPDWTTAGVVAGATFAAGLGQQREKRGGDGSSSSSDTAVWDGDGNDGAKISGSGARRRRSQSGSRSRSNSRGRITPRRAAATRASRRAASAGSPQLELPGPPAPIATAEEPAVKPEDLVVEVDGSGAAATAAAADGPSPASEASGEQMSPVGTPESYDGDEGSPTGGSRVDMEVEEEVVPPEIEAEVASAPVPPRLDAPVLIRGSAGPGHPGAPVRIGGTPSAGAAAVTAERAEGGGGFLPPPPPPVQ